MEQYNLEYDATPSWSGYNYQGKIALYVTIEKICELYRNNKLSEIGKYSLELEWLEDFSIKYNNLYKSIHQVKALDTVDISRYDEAIFGLISKVIIHETIENAYLHTWKAANYNKDMWKDTIKVMAQNSYKNSSLVNEMENLLMDNGKFDELYKRICKPLRGAVPDLIKRIQLHLSDDVTKENVRDAITKAIEFTKQDSSVYVEKLTDSNLDKICIYDYEGIYSCDLDEIKIKILDGINKHLILQGNDWRTADSSYKEIIYLYLMALIDKNITQRHKMYSSKNKVSIPFTDINNILCNLNLNKHSKEYYLYKLKEKFYNVQKDYCIACTKKKQDVNICSKCNIVNVVEEIKKMDLDTFEKLCRILCPDKNGEIEIEYQYMLEKSSLGASVFKSLREIKNGYQFQGDMIRFKSNENKTSLATSVEDDGMDNSASFICIRILENTNIDGLFMDIDELISKDIDADSIVECANKINALNGYAQEEFDESEHILHCKKVAIRRAEDVIRRFNS